LRTLQFSRRTTKWRKTFCWRCSYSSQRLIDDQRIWRTAWSYSLRNRLHKILKLRNLVQ
jgi:hypothetical protein